MGPTPERSLRETMRGAEHSSEMTLVTPQLPQLRLLEASQPVAQNRPSNHRSKAGLKGIRYRPLLDSPDGKVFSSELYAARWTDSTVREP
jgi:hypothetical protein